MRTRSSSNLVGESSPNPTTSNPKHHNRRRSKQSFSLEESPLDTMADQRTIMKLLSAPTEGYAEAIVVPPILAEHFELKHSLINMMTSDISWIEKDSPHDTSLCLVADGNTFLGISGLYSRNSFQADAVNYNQGSSGNTIANPKGELKAITTRSGLILDGPSILMPPPFINLKEDERAEETLTDPGLAEYTIKVPPPLVQKAKPTSLKNYVVHKRDPLHPNIPYPSRMHQEKQQEKDEVQIHKFWQMFKQLHINISLADALILIPKYQKMLKSLLSNKEKLLELANTPLNENCSAVILKKLPEKLGDPGKFLIPCGFSELKCKALADLGASINLMPLSVWKKLGLPELISTRMTLELANRAICTPAGIARDVFVPVGKFTFPADFVIVDYENSILEDSVDKGNLADDLVDTIPEMFTDEHNLDYSSPPLHDDVDDDLVELESDNDNVYDDPFDSKEDKIKESKLLIDELDPPRSSDFLPSPECDSVLYEDFFEVDALPSTNNEDKVFNPGILIHENLFEVTIRVTPDKNVKKISISNASLILEDFNPPLYELPFHKEVPGFEILLSFSSENAEKVFNLGILTSKGIHTSLFPELSHRDSKAFKVIKIFKSPMEIFPCSYGEDIRILDVPCLHFYPP
ncbi:reverse transcriptase domain-containing protein [Tanacetum coccineum]